jgi:hypothetical protein
MCGAPAAVIGGYTTNILLTGILIGGGTVATDDVPKI